MRPSVAGVPLLRTEDHVGGLHRYLSEEQSPRAGPQHAVHRVRRPVNSAANNQ